MISIKQLIQVAPFPDDIKAQLLEKADTFSGEKKFEVEKTCWDLIATEYENKIQFAMQTKAHEALQKGEEVPQEEFKAIEEQLFTELTKKLSIAGSDEALEEVRKKLQTHVAPPTNS